MGKSRFARVSHVKVECANLGATDLIFVSFYSALTELLLSNTTTFEIQ